MHPGYHHAVNQTIGTCTHLAWSRPTWLAYATQADWRREPNAPLTTGPGRAASHGWGPTHGSSVRMENGPTHCARCAPPPTRAPLPFPGIRAPRLIQSTHRSVPLRGSSSRRRCHDGASPNYTKGTIQTTSSSRQTHTKIQ
jgi:hypothetical protein